MHVCGEIIEIMEHLRVGMIIWGVGRIIWGVVGDLYYCFCFVFRSVAV